MDSKNKVNGGMNAGNRLTAVRGQGLGAWVRKTKGLSHFLLWLSFLSVKMIIMIAKSYFYVPDTHRCSKYTHTYTYSLIFMMIPQERYICYFHFTDRKIEAQSLEITQLVSGGVRTHTQSPCSQSLC